MKDEEIVRCKDCKHRDPEDKKCDCGGMPWDTQILPVPDDWYCPYGERNESDPEMWRMNDIDEYDPPERRDVIAAGR